ncbi:hypothetical protein ACFQRB_20140 [Halobaculum litoreum]|uniref:Uncharacterized protein n=1 Tax=Halobaculum litoreum TaxID=3031998 RepID=A0ABD5XSU2_9EURY
MDSEDEGETPITAREGSPIDAEEKRAMVRELDRAIRYGSPGVTTARGPPSPAVPSRSR